MYVLCLKISLSLNYEPAVHNVHTEDTTLASADIELPSPTAALPPDTIWYRKLELAQNVLFCKEVFAQVMHIINIYYSKFVFTVNNAFMHSVH